MAEATSTKTYVLVWLALLALLAITWASAYIHIGWGNAAINMGIAATKAMLVAVFFMHLRRGTALSRLFAAAGVFWLAILFTLTLSDYLTRG